MSLLLTRRALLQTAAAAPLHLGRPIRVGIVGFEGHVGDIIKPLDSLPEVKITAISSTDSADLARQAKRKEYAGAKVYADWRAMLAQEQLDVLAVTNDDGARAGVVLAGLERGLAVIAEKPLATKEADLERIKAALQRRPVPLGLILPHRCEPQYMAMREIVRSGEIGEPAQLDAQKSYQTKDVPAWKRKEESYGGTLNWIGPHLADIMRWVSGREMVSVMARQQRVGRPEFGDMQNTSAALFALDNGGTATMRLDFLRPDAAPTHGDDRLRIAGTKGVVEYQASTGVTVITHSQPPRRIEARPPAQSVFVDFLRGAFAGAAPVVTVQDALRVTELVLAATRSAAEGRLVRL